jgi:predicted dienelactone hydrolase
MTEPRGKVGCRRLATEDSVQKVPLPFVVFYPTLAPEAVERFGPYEISVAADAPPEGERIPLVAISHGTGGSGLVYRDLSAYLARAGFAVAFFDHPGNNRNDDRLKGTAINLENRPRHVRRVIDAAFADPLLGPRLAPGKVGLLGHSMGGYTGLALAGGRPRAFAHETPEGTPRPLFVESDPRLRALVLLAPATGWYMGDGALANVDLPILMVTGEKDEHTPPFHADVVKRGVRDPSRIDHRVIPNGGHFAFLTPFPAAMVTPGFLPAQDPEGFDRAAYHRVMNPAIEAFLRGALDVT